MFRVKPQTLYSLGLGDLCENGFILAAIANLSQCLPLQEQIPNCVLLNQPGISHLFPQSTQVNESNKLNKKLTIHAIGKLQNVESLKPVFSNYNQTVKRFVKKILPQSSLFSGFRGYSYKILRKCKSFLTFNPIAAGTYDALSQ